MKTMIAVLLAAVWFAPGFASAQGAGDVMVGAYYYPWYRAPGEYPAKIRKKRVWTNRTLRGRLVPDQQPALGTYSSRSGETIGAHIAQSKRGGIDFWVLSWWGPESLTDVNSKDHIFTHPDAGTLNYALFYETEGRFGSFSEPDFSRLLRDFKYMEKHYFGSPHYLKIDGKPVVFIYLSRAYFRGRGQEKLRRLREECPNLYLVGDDVFREATAEAGAPEGSYTPEYARLWDAVTAYDVYGQSTRSLGGTRAALEHLNATYDHARKVANSVGTGFIPAVSPGYNDKSVREGHPGRSRTFRDVPASAEGDLFRAMIRDVGLQNLDPLGGHMMMVNSFNEWYEDTQIEPTAGMQPPTATDNSSSGRFYTEGRTYTDYGTLYLDILREETEGINP